MMKVFRLNDKMKVQYFMKKLTTFVAVVIRRINLSATTLILKLNSMELKRRIIKTTKNLL